MFIESIPLEFLLDCGLQFRDALHLREVVSRFNRHCEAGVPFPIGTSIYCARPLFTSQAELLSLVSDHRPLVILREPAPHGRTGRVYRGFRDRDLD